MKSWSFGGGPGSVTYRLFDLVRAWLNRGLVAYLSRSIVLRQGSRVLEAGSGPAIGSSLFLRRGEVSLSVALDIDIDALREAKRRDPQLAVVVGDLYSLPFAPATFDLVWNNSTIEHLAKPLSALAEMQGVTRKDGYLFVGVPYRFGLLGFQPWVARTQLGIWLGPVFGNEQLQHMAKQLQLKLVDIRVYFFRFFVGMLAKRV